ncbi:MAG TPA: PspC domain-containing protein [Actinomycetes bacterium]|nr:PspC domain-containing protein [Actinomycetes bacterium]
MSENPYVSPPSQESAPPPTPAPARQLRRSKDGRVLGGVCGGLARYLGIDPVIVRVVVVVLALFGGGGVILYGAAWLLIPEEGRTESAGQQLIGNRSSQTVLVVVVAVVIALAIAAPFGGMWFGFSPHMGPHFGPPGILLIVAAVALVIWLIRRDEHPQPHDEVTMTPAPSLTDPTQQTVVLPQPLGSATPPVGPPTAPLPPTPPVPPIPPKQKAPRSVLGLLTVSAAAAVVGVLVMVNLGTETADIGATTVFGSALAVVGAGLLIGTYFGRSRGLIVLGVFLTAATAISAAAPSVDISAGIGDRTWRPMSVSEVHDSYELGIGQGTLDLRSLDVSATQAPVPLTASVGIGELDVLVPDNVDVQVTAKVGLGEIEVAGRQQVNGSDRVVTTLIDVPHETGLLNLNLETGMGQVRVRQVSNALTPPLTPGGSR